MPYHAIAAHLAAFFAPVAAIMALAYCWLQRSRQGMRVPLVVTSVLALVFATWAEFSGTDLWHELQAALGGSLPAVTTSHKAYAESLVMATLVFAIIVVSVVWKVVAPGRRGTVATLWAAVISILAVAMIGLAGGAVYEAMASVWLHHTPLR